MSLSTTFFHVFFFNFVEVVTDISVKAF